MFRCATRPGVCVIYTIYMSIIYYKKDNFGKNFLFLFSSSNKDGDSAFLHLESSVPKWPSFMNSLTYLCAGNFSISFTEFIRILIESSTCFRVIDARRGDLMWLNIEKPLSASTLPIGGTRILWIKSVVLSLHFIPGWFKSWDQKAYVSTSEVLIVQKFGLSMIETNRSDQSLINLRQSVTLKTAHRLLISTTS